jgi:hypothetical protein
MGDLTNSTLQPFAILAQQDRMTTANLGDVFLLNPANRSFVEGKTKQLASRNPRTGCILLFLAPFLLVGIAVMMWAGSDLYQWNALKQAGINAVAEISDKRVATDEDSETYYLSYRYSNRDTIYTHEQSVSLSAYNHAEIGAKLDITYVPDNPYMVALAGTNNPPWFPIGLGICWNLLIWPIFIAMFIAMWGNRLLEKQGCVVKGQVVASDSTIDGDGDLILKLDYSFGSPDGNQVIQGTTQQSRNDLKGQALPAQGAPLAILYRNDKHHKLL